MSVIHDQIFVAALIQRRTRKTQIGVLTLVTGNKQLKSITHTHRETRRRSTQESGPCHKTNEEALHRYMREQPGHIIMHEMHCVECTE